MPAINVAHLPRQASPYKPSAIQAQRRTHSLAQPAPRLSLPDANQAVHRAEYAVRGLIPTKAEQLREQLAAHPDSLPFSSIINANIGNPQQLKQPPLTFYRQVLACMQDPHLIDAGIYPEDVCARAKRLLENVGPVGAYSHSQGSSAVRHSVADFISHRDGGHGDANNIFLTTGASDAVKNIFDVLLRGRQDGVLIPIPQYPLYTAAIALKQATPLPYYLNEEASWSTDPQEIEQVVQQSRNFGITPKILVVINPGNPTGAILSRDAIRGILTVAAKEGLVVIADEVYQENVFVGEFHSFKSVLNELQQGPRGAFFDNVQLCSLHSTSKGVSGECGQRGGYMELVGFSPELKALFTKLASISLCPVVTGQVLIELMVNPPKEGDASYEQDQKERAAIHASYKNKAEKLYDEFKLLKNIEVQKPQGAMYLFPKIIFTDSAKAAAAEAELKPDEFYCLRLLENTGICVVPGSGFGQKEGTFHVRTTFLPPGDEWIKSWARFHEEFFTKYSDGKQF